MILDKYLNCLNLRFLNIYYLAFVTFVAIGTVIDVIVDSKQIIVVNLTTDYDCFVLN